VLKVRLVADLEERVAIVAARDGISLQQAEQFVAKADEARRLWGQHLYGVDRENPLLYNTVLHVGKLGVDGTSEMICNLVKQDPFRITSQALERLVELSRIADAEALIAEMDVDLAAVRIMARAGVIRIGIKTTRRTREGTSNRPRSYFVRDLRDRLRKRAAERLEPPVAVELIDHESDGQGGG
jgi:hypothetical protein